MSEEDQHIPEQAPAPRRSLWWWFRRIAVGGALLLLSINLVFQIPAVQTWAAQRLTQILTNALDTKVSIDFVHLAWFDELRLEGFYIEDAEQDTLLYSRELNADFNLNPFVFFRSGLEIQEVSLKDAEINQRRAEESYTSNIQQLLAILFPPDTARLEKDRRPFRMNIERVFLENVQYLNDDRAKGARLAVLIGKGKIWIDSMDLPARRFAISGAELWDPVVSIENLPQRLPGEFPVDTVPVPSEMPADTQALHLTVDAFRLHNGQFSLHNYRKAAVKLTPPDMLDFQHLDIFEIDITINCFSFQDQVWRGQVPHISLKDASGFVLKELAASEAMVSPTGIQLDGLKIETPYSLIGDQLSFEYPEYAAFAEFPNEVTIRANLNSDSVALRDIMVFVPALEQNTFFLRNRDEVLSIRGSARGEINNLRGSNLNIELTDGTLIRGSFSSRNLAIRNEEFINLRLEQLRTSMGTMRQLIPNFRPPANFDRLGRINFSGRFDGFFVDFVANGDLRTEIGRARMDMRMDLKQGRAKANYSGELTLENFDLGKWTANPEFGIVNFTSSVKDGFGLTGETARAQLQAAVQSFNFRNYTYENALINGELNRTFFNGEFNIQDDNIDFSFKGEIDFTDSIPTFDFDANINRLDMKRLNLIEQDLVLAGQVDLNLLNSRLSDIEGQALIRNLRLLRNRQDSFFLDSLYISSDTDTTGFRQLDIRSEALQGTVTGHFDIEQIPEAFIRYFERNYPGFAHRFGIRSKNKDARENDFSFDLTLFDSKGFNRLIDPKLERLRDITLRGHFDSNRDSILVDLAVPSLQIGKVALIDFYLQLDAVADEGEMLTGVWSVVLNEKQKTAPIAILSLLDRDTMTFTLNYSTNTPSLLANLNLNGWFYLADTSNFKIKFDQSNLFILENLWAIDRDNFIVFGKDFIDTRNFILTNRDRRITLESQNQKGLKLSLTNFDFSLIDDYWDYDQLDFEGRFEVTASIGNVFDLTDIKATAIADTLLINDDDWGAFHLDAETRDLKSKVNTFLSITKGASQLLAEGSYNLANLKEAPQGRALPDSLQARFFDFSLGINSYPLDIAEYFIGDVISGVEGRFDANLRLRGLPQSPDVMGLMDIRQGGVTVNFLQTRYTFEQSIVSVNNYLFDVSTTVLRDRLGHRAEIRGGIRHNRLRDFGFAATLNTDRFLALDTKKGDNKQFYGQAIGSGQVEFTGSFQKPDILIAAVVDDSTQISIPISSEREASELNFIRFVQKHRSSSAQQERPANELPRGLALEMNLEVRDQARVKLIFDEQAGDIIEGRGRGNIQILLPREGDFQMFGNYIIEEGEYLFTLYDVINKDFSINRGGTIQWNGDPYSANINIVAEYKDLTAPVFSLISEYLTTDQDRRDAGNITNVDLQMKLQGDLLQPIINFDLSFPNLVGRLQSYAESKLRYLRQDPNELNRQVFGLIVLGQFIPSTDLPIQGPEILYNTVSEFVSNQLSLLITELFSEFIADGQVLSGIDFDIAYNQYQAYDLAGQEQGQPVNRGDEFQVKLKQNFFNDRLTILVGGNVDFGANVATSPEASGAFVGNDLVIEYILSKDRSLKLRVYQRLQPDIGGGRRFQVGTGLSFRREFDSFGEFLKSFRRASDQAKDL